MSRGKVVYSTNFKNLAVNQVLEGEGIAQVAKKLKVSIQTLSRWVKMKKEQEQSTDKAPTEKEFKKLKRELEKSKIKIAILKKTLKIFSSEEETDIL